MKPLLLYASTFALVRYCELYYFFLSSFSNWQQKYAHPLSDPVSVTPTFRFLYIFILYYLRQNDVLVLFTIISQIGIGNILHISILRKFGSLYPNAHNPAY